MAACATDDLLEVKEAPSATPAGPELSHAAPDAVESSPEAELDALRTSWHFAAIIQFCRMFKTLLRIRPFSADILERALLDPSGHRMFLSELLCKLLRPDTSAPYGEQDCDAWEDLLTQKFRASWRSAFADYNPLAEQGFYALSPSLKVWRPQPGTISVCRLAYIFSSKYVGIVVQVEVLYAVCDWRIHDCPVVRESLRLTVRI